MKRWEAVEAFVQVVDVGSFSAAAEVLGVSKSHVSRRVSELENRLGTQLLNRTTRRLALTETGRAYYQRCRGVLVQMEEAEQAVIDLQDTPRGTLRVTVAGAFGERYVAPAATHFMQQHHHLDVHLDFTNRNVDLVEEGYDLAIRSGVLKDSSLIARRIAGRPLKICGSRDYLARYGVPDSIPALKHHSCLIGSLPTWRFRDSAGHHTDVKLEGRWRSNNGHALLEAAKRGLGLVQLPSFYVREDVQAGRLQSVMEAFQPADTAIWAVYPSNRHLSPKVRLFVEHLIQWCESDPALRYQ
ncbi:LysR family transcriptional regulator [Spongiibacter nanhainus]|uniref:LysR family transcriptional regulator n=1 Tax=Spongiibacter nanhainus TaxID=2794344 RepID=UPI001E4B6CC4|nr:LysR family transcriptional regulator [Spongiibacter nanhainus]